MRAATVVQYLATGTRLAVCTFLLAAAPAAACPFCTAVGPTLVQQRDAAAVAAVGELVVSNSAERQFRLHYLLRGGDLLPDPAAVTLAAGDNVSPGGLALLLATGEAGEELKWEVTPLDELSASYVLRAPDQRTPAAERLPFFIPYLEHPQALLAEDAYREFGHAPFDAVADAVPLLASESLQAWLSDPQTPPQRQGFYGLALGLRRDPQERAAAAEFLREQIVAPAGDFRAGFDGLLGGYLMAAGETALELIASRLLADLQAAHGDVRHALAALRFYQEFGREIPREKLAAALRLALARPEFAAAAVADLARWQDWNALPQVAAMWDAPGFGDGPTRRAVLSYLLLCPGEEAREAAARIAQEQPEFAEQIRRQLTLETGR